MRPAYLDVPYTATNSSPGRGEAGRPVTQPTPVSMNPGVRMFARCGGLFIQPSTVVCASAVAVGEVVEAAMYTFSAKVAQTYPTRVARSHG